MIRLSLPHLVLQVKITMSAKMLPIRKRHPTGFIVMLCARSATNCKPVSLTKKFNLSINGVGEKTWNSLTKKIRISSCYMYTIHIKK